MKKVEITPKNFVDKTNLFDLIFPVGTVVKFSINNKTPAERYGGVWERIAKGKVIVGVDEDDVYFTAPTYTKGSDGQYSFTEKSGGNLNHTHTLNNGFAKINIGWDDNQNCLSSKGKHSTNWHADRKTTTNNQSYSLNNSRDCATELGGTTDNSSNLQPYITAYIWRRVA